MRAIHMLVPGLLALSATALAQEQTAPTAATPSVAEAIEEFKTRWTEMRESGQATRESQQELAREVMEGIEVSQLSVSEIEQLAGVGLLQITGQVEDANTRLDEFAAQEDADGAVAGVLKLLLTPRRQAPSPDTIAELLRHPGLKDALKQGRGTQVFRMLGSLRGDDLGELFDEIQALEPALAGSDNLEVALALPSLVGALLELEGEEYTEGRERLRVLAKECAEAAAKKAEGDNPDAAEYLHGRVKFLDGAFARGQLIDHPAPGITFNWSSDGKLKSLAELKGKVVVLDFWATWCGPCVASFPKVRELAAHYEGFPVVVVGVTSLQGKHYAEDGPVDCEGDPDKEYELMKGYLPEKDITWTIAFSEQEVFNPDYGVQGIPHVAILDASGKVRYNGLHPGSDLEEKIAKIDALLKEAGLAHPQG